MADALLLETGDFLLLETGDKLLLEGVEVGSIVAPLGRVLRARRFSALVARFHLVPEWEWSLNPRLNLADNMA